MPNNVNIKKIWPKFRLTITSCNSLGISKNRLFIFWLETQFNVLIVLFNAKILKKSIIHLHGPVSFSITSLRPSCQMCHWYSNRHFVSKYQHSYFTHSNMYYINPGREKFITPSINCHLNLFQIFRTL